MNNKIIKITLGILIIFILGGTCYGYSKTLKDEEYLILMNSSISNMKESTYHKGGSYWKSLFGSIDDNYLVPEIDKQTLLKNGVSKIKANTTDIKIRNKETKQMHQEIIDKYDDIIILLDKDIKIKTDILNNEGDDSTKYELIKNIDPTIKSDIEKKFYEIDLILQNIEVKSIK